MLRRGVTGVIVILEDQEGSVSVQHPVFQGEDGEPQPEPELEEDFSSDYWL